MTGKICRLIALMLLAWILAGCAGPSECTYLLDVERIRQDTEYLCGEIGIRVTGTEKERETADWIESALREAGFGEGQTLERAEFESNLGLRSENIIAVCNRGADGPIFSVVAHYDSVETSPGARDNAASVAALLEIARYLGVENAAVPCEIRLVFLGSEENGYHGSKAYVEAMSEEERNRHKAAFNMDISVASDDEGAQLVCNTLGSNTDLGYEEGNFIVPAEGDLAEAIRRAYRELYGRELGGVFHFGESDHVSFHNAELEAANICWRKVDGGMPVLTERYHKMEDTPEDLNYDTVCISAACILRAMEILSQ